MFPFTSVSLPQIRIDRITIQICPHVSWTVGIVPIVAAREAGASPAAAAAAAAAGTAAASPATAAAGTGSGRVPGTPPEVHRLARPVAPPPPARQGGPEPPADSGGHAWRRHRRTGAVAWRRHRRPGRAAGGASSDGERHLRQVSWPADWAYFQGDWVSSAAHRQLEWRRGSQ